MILCFWVNSLEMPLAVGKFGSGVQIQIACSSTMSVVARSESISLMPPLLTICFISESATMPVAPVLPCEAEAAVPLWPDLDWVFVVFGETGRWRQPGYVTDLNFEAKTNKNPNYDKSKNISEFVCDDKIWHIYWGNKSYSPT